MARDCAGGKQAQRIESILKETFFDEHKHHDETKEDTRPFYRLS